MSESNSILFFINMTLYLIIHNLKFRRYSENNLSKKINIIFSGLIFLIMILLLRQVIWGSNVITYIDTILVLVIVSVLAFIIIKNIILFIELLFKVYEKKKSILESAFLTVLIISGLLFDPFWFVSFVVMMVFLIKEAFLMSDSIKSIFD